MSESLPGADDLKQAVAVEVAASDVAAHVKADLMRAIQAATAAEQAVNELQFTDHVPHEKQTFDVGPACQLLGITPMGLRIVLEEIGAGFSGAHNSRPFITGDVLLAVHHYVSDLRRAVADQDAEQEHAATEAAADRCKESA